MTTFDKDNLPSDPATWPLYQKDVLTRMVKIDGPFTVMTDEGSLCCDDGYLAMDSRGNFYPIATEEQALSYKPAGAPTPVAEESDTPDEAA